MNDDYIIALLEQIAYNTQKGPLEREEYLGRIRNASSFGKATPVHGGGVGAEASGGENTNGDERGATGGLCGQAGQGVQAPIPILKEKDVSGLLRPKWLGGRK